MTLCSTPRCAIRSEEGHTGDVRSLFHRVGNKYADSLSFEAEMILPPEGIDDLGQKGSGYDDA